ncbi:M20/M25/M40 family metallo-hydrolase [Bacteroidota bacterium]
MKLRSILIGIIICTAVSLAQNSLIHHNINAVVDPVTSSVTVTDEITIPAEQVSAELKFKLHTAMSTPLADGGFEIKLIRENIAAGDVGMDREEEENGLRLNEYQIGFAQNYSGDLVIKLNYSGIIESPIEQSEENYARGFSESPGIISEIGVYLAGSTYWTPYFDDKLFTFTLTSTTPSGWSTVSQGTRTKFEDTDGSHTDTWDSPEPMEEVFLIAAQFTQYDYSVGAVTAMAFLRTPDDALSNKYLTTTAQYLEMYRQLVGRYPYSKFALVENFWETGYGMPSFTLLGETIIRFPFILHSSYPHELLHNWWGNSVYVDFKTGNWCEGLTAYMADHLIKEQRGQGADYRRSTLQKFTSYVYEANDFPLNEFRSRFDAPSEAIGYGKSLMMWNMLRAEIGDENFVRGFQTFYRTNKFKNASFGDIRQSMEEVSEKDLSMFFDQWVKRTGAPELQLKDVAISEANGSYVVDLSIIQIQKEDSFKLNIPVVIYTSDSTYISENAEMVTREQKFNFNISEKPVRVDIDPQFDIMRKLHYSEIPPALATAFGSEEVLIVLSSNEGATDSQLYDSLANKWAEDKPGKLKIVSDTEINELPSDKAVWVFGWKNKFKKYIASGLTDYNCSLNENSFDIYDKNLVAENNSFIVSVRNAENPKEAVVWLTIGSNGAVPGLVRKLPHYGKYSYLVFEGDEPTNIEKGQWPVVNSPLSADLSGGTITEYDPLQNREALATLKPVFSSDELMKHVKYLASEELKGRGLGTEELGKAAQYIADQFKEAGLMPAGDNDTYFQNWNESAGKEKKSFSLKNVIGIIPGSDENLKGESVVISAHYDHLGLGWPDVRKGNEGKIHYGADDNASGVAVMIELAKLISKSGKPKRTIVFAAFTGEESGLLGSRHYVNNYTEFPADKVIANINLDTVGRLFGNKLLIINGETAREWKFIFMGTEYVTGIPISLVTQELDASDQVSFIEKEIPSIQIFSGPEEDYHKPTDTFEKIDVDGLVKVAAVTKEVLEYLAEREEPLTYTGPVKEEKSETETEEKPVKKERRVSTGTMPDFQFTGEGVKIGAVSPGSPADKAGLITGDIIVKFEDITIKTLTDYSNALKTKQPGDVVTIEYIRDGESKTVQLELAER